MKSTILKTAICIFVLTVLVGTVCPADAYPYYVEPVTKIIMKGVKLLPNGTIVIKKVIMVLDQIF